VAARGACAAGHRDSRGGRVSSARFIRI